MKANIHLIGSCVKTQKISLAKVHKLINEKFYYISSKREIKIIRLNDNNFFVKSPLEAYNLIEILKSSENKKEKKVEILIKEKKKGTKLKKALHKLNKHSDCLNFRTDISLSNLHKC